MLLLAEAAVVLWRAMMDFVDIAPLYCYFCVVCVC